jgi:dolichyl-phosphate-mannose--protein O-mannosyl transferase
MAERLMLGALPSLLAHMQMNYAQAIFMVIFLFCLVGTWIKKPYLEPRQSYRQVANYSIAVAIQGVYLVPTFITDSSSKLLIYAPMAVLALLLACFFYNAVFLVKELCKEKKDTSIFSSKEEENNELKMTRNET